MSAERPNGSEPHRPEGEPQTLAGRLRETVRELFRKPVVRYGAYCAEGLAVISLAHVTGMTEGSVLTGRLPVDLALAVTIPTILAGEVLLANRALRR